MAGVVVLLAIGISIPFWEAAWLSIAYERQTVSDDGLAFFRKRISWMPGPLTKIPDQSCPSCRRGEHDDCGSITGPGTILMASGSSVTASRITFDGGSRTATLSDDCEFSLRLPDGDHLRWTPNDWSCTCRDPSHEDER